jgi:hypothetical protein
MIDYRKQVQEAVREADQEAVAKEEVQPSTDVEDARGAAVDLLNKIGPDLVADYGELVATAIADARILGRQQALEEMQGIAAGADGLYDAETNTLIVNLPAAIARHKTLHDKNMAKRIALRDARLKAVTKEATLEVLALIARVIEENQDQTDAEVLDAVEKKIEVLRESVEEG